MSEPEYQSPPPSALRKFHDNIGKPLLTIVALLLLISSPAVNMIEAIIELPVPLRALISLNLAFLGLLCLFLIHLINVSKEVRQHNDYYTGQFADLIHAFSKKMDEYEARTAKSVTELSERVDACVTELSESATAAKSEIGKVLLQAVEELKRVDGQTNALSERVSRLEAGR